MIRTYYRDKLAYKLFDSSLPRDIKRGIRNMVSGGENYKDFEIKEPGIFDPRRSDKRAGFDWIPQVAAPALAGLGTGMALWNSIPTQSKLTKGGIATLAGLAAAEAARRLTLPREELPQYQEAVTISQTQPDYIGSTALGGGLGALTGAGIGYAVGNSAGLVPGAFVGAGLGGYLGYKYPDWAGTSI